MTFISLVILISSVTALAILFWSMSAEKKRIKNFMQRVMNDFTDLQSEPERSRLGISAGPVRLLMENMGYFEEVNNELLKSLKLHSANESHKIEQKNSAEILRFLDRPKHQDFMKMMREMQAHDIIALPYFAIKEARNEGLILSLPEVLEAFESVSNDDYGGGKRLMEAVVKNVVDIKWDHIRGAILDENDKVLAIPFTYISSLLVSHRINTNGEQQTGVKVLKERLLNEGHSAIHMLAMDDNEARSHFYEFLNFVTIEAKNGIQDLIKTLPDSGVQIHITKEILRALKLYLRFYYMSEDKMDNWRDHANLIMNKVENNPDEALIAFVWSEQIADFLVSERPFEFEALPNRSQLEGWAWCVVKKPMLNPNLPQVLKSLADLSQSKFWFKRVLSSPIPTVFSEVESDLKERERKVARVINDATRNSTPVAYNTFIGDIMKCFSLAIMKVTDSISSEDSKNYNQLAMDVIDSWDLSLKLTSNFDRRISFKKSI